MRPLAPLLLLGALTGAPPARATPVEVFGGHQRTTFDTLYVHAFRKRKVEGAEAASEWLLFFRARVGFAYTGTEAERLPQFGLTAAVSYNPRVLHGLGVVVVGQAFNTGPVAKAGVQGVRVRDDHTVFGWVVVEIGPRPAIDGFVLGRYVHPLGERYGAAFQAEALLVFPTDPARPFSFTERLRTGFQIDRWQLGPGIDLQQLGRDAFTFTVNAGGYLRYDF